MNQKPIIMAFTAADNIRILRRGLIYAYVLVSYFVGLVKVTKIIIIIMYLE